MEASVNLLAKFLERQCSGYRGTGSIYGQGVDANDTLDLNLDYVLYHNDMSPIIAAGSSSEGHNIMSVAGATALSENAIYTGEYITPDYEVDSHDLAAGLSFGESSAC